MATLANLVVKVTGDSSSMERTMDRASRKMRSFSREAERLLSSRLTQALSLTAVTIGMQKAFRAADALDASNRKLAATAKITGQNLGFLQVTAQNANREFGLGATLANEFAIEVTKLTSKAGAIEQTSAAIGALLNLGAGRGYNATETLQAVQQAILGIDEGTDKLFGKNPSVIYAEFARQVGISAGKMTDADKAMALLSASMVDGGKVAGQYADFLKSPAGQAERLRIQMEETAAGIGRSMNGLRLVVMPILAEMAEGFRKFTGGIQILAVDVAVLVARIKAKWAELPSAIARGGREGFGVEERDKAREHLERVMASAEEVRTQIVRSMDLATTITGPTNPLAAVFDQVAESAEEATEAAKKLADQVTKALRGRGRIGLSQTHNPLGLNEDGRARSFATREERRLFGERGGTLAPASVSAASATALENRDLGGGGGGIGGVLGQIGGALKSQIGGIIAQFGPLAAVAAALKPVFEGIMEVLGPVLETLGEPLKLIGRLIGAQIAPALKLLEAPLNFLARASSYVTEGFGWLIRAIGKAAGALSFGAFGAGLREAGQDMIDMARETRRALGATEDATEATQKFTAALLNVPRVIHINALRHRISGGGPVNPTPPIPPGLPDPSAPPRTPGTPERPGTPTDPGIPGGPDGSGGGGGNPRRPRPNPGGGGGGAPGGTGDPAFGPLFRGTTVFNIYSNAVDPKQVAHEVGRYMERVAARGGMTRIGLAAG